MQLCGAFMSPAQQAVAFIVAAAAVVDGQSGGSGWSAINASGDWANPSANLSQCPLTSKIAALNSPCTCSCAANGTNSANTSGCTEKSGYMYSATGYTCAQVAGGSVPNLACNQLVRDITAAEAYSLWVEGKIDLVVDVRSEAEYESLGNSTEHNECGGGYTDSWDGCEIGHIPGGE